MVDFGAEIQANSLNQKLKLMNVSFTRSSAVAIISVKSVKSCAVSFEFTVLIGA